MTPVTPKICPESLRLGNLINYKGKPERVQLYMLQEIIHLNQDYSPIELTEDILSKCGFELYGVEYKLRLVSKGFDICWSERDRVYLDIDLGYGTDYLDNIKYIHQLQNLYHSLTGEELNVQL